MKVRVEVRDSNPRPPVIAAIMGFEEAANDQAETGRGLIIVDALASTRGSGSSPVGRGKTTRFELGVWS
ncbi:hypothetical protein [Streptomyces sp. NPDC048473]|uniref:hypothetical protein n=1 Tax=unclassified Streptomyces TaxID=2593676 RepID=UPI003716F35D